MFSSKLKICWFQSNTLPVSMNKIHSLHMNSSSTTCKFQVLRWWQKNALTSTNCRKMNTISILSTLKIRTSLWKNSTLNNVKELKLKRMNLWAALTKTSGTIKSVKVHWKQQKKLEKPILTTATIRSTQLMEQPIGLFVMCWQVTRNIIRVSVFTSNLFKRRRVNRIDIFSR